MRLNEVNNCELARRSAALACQDLPKRVCARDDEVCLYEPQSEGLSRARGWHHERAHWGWSGEAWRSRLRREVRHRRAKTFAFTAQKTMMAASKGDTVFVLASENDGGQGLIARGVVNTSAAAVAKKAPGKRRA